MHPRTEAAESIRDDLLRDRVAAAKAALRQRGALTDRRTRRVSARLDPGLVAAAMERSGIESETQLLEAALALLAEPDDFGAWLIRQRGRLDPDFELAV